MLRWAATAKPGPVSIRYPRGGDGAYTDCCWNEACENVCVHRLGKDLTIITYGALVNHAIQAAEILAEDGIDAAVLRLMCINPLPIDEILHKMSDGKYVFVAEEIAGNCGIREQIAYHLKLSCNDCTVSGVDLGNQYIQHGAVGKLYDFYGLSPEKIAQKIKEERYSEN